MAIAPKGSGAEWDAHRFRRDEREVTFPVSNSTQFSVEFGFFASPSVSE